MFTQTQTQVNGLQSTVVLSVAEGRRHIKLAISQHDDWSYTFERNRHTFTAKSNHRKYNGLYQVTYTDNSAHAYPRYQQAYLTGN